MFLPVWALLYVKQRASRTSSSRRLSASEASALPFTALLSIALELPLILPAWFDADPATIQHGMYVLCPTLLSLGLGGRS